MQSLGYVYIGCGTFGGADRCGANFLLEQPLFGSTGGLYRCGATLWLYVPLLWRYPLLISWCWLSCFRCSDQIQRCPPLLIRKRVCAAAVPQRHTPQPRRHGPQEGDVQLP